MFSIFVELVTTAVFHSSRVANEFFAPWRRRVESDNVQPGPALSDLVSMCMFQVRRVSRDIVEFRGVESVLHAG